MEHILKSRYKIGDKISENPFSVTYRGFFIGTDRPVVIKIYKRGTLNSSLIKSMKHKVREFSLIGHHGIAKILDGDYGWQGFYYVREHVEGQTLQELLSRGERIGVERAVTIATEVLNVLEAVHAKGIVHAALKPSNIFIDHQGIVKVTDFIIEGEIKEAMPQKVIEIMQDANYASPEELEGKPVTPLSDLYSLGLILFEMASGKAAVAGSGLAVNAAKLKTPVIIPKDSLSGLPRYLEEIILKAAQRDPLLRFASAAEFRDSLAQQSIAKKSLESQGLAQIFEATVTEYGGEEIDKESEMLQEVGRVRIRWSKEKHRNWILAIVVAASVVLGVAYAFFFGR
jgi:serine/threonine-protein kinase